MGGIYIQLESMLRHVESEILTLNSEKVIVIYRIQLCIDFANFVLNESYKK